MARISTYPIVSIPTLNDLLIGTDVENLNETKNFSLGDISGLIGQGFVPYVGATGNVNLGVFSLEAASFIVEGGLASEFVKANGSLDSTVYTPQTRTLTINGVTYNLSANRAWDLNTIDTLTTTGTSGAATYIGKTLNIPVYQAQGAYITQLSGEATAVGPGNATVTLDNTAVIGKILSGLNVTGGTVVSTDTILQAFGKVQNQINALAGGVEYQGVWNAATNNPFLQSSVGVQGHYYVVNVAGNTNLNGITDWQVGDWAIFNGSTWDKVDNTDAVVSVNGYVGAVVLTASDVGAVPTTRTLTINGVGYDLSADRSWTVGDVRTDQTYANPSWITSLAWTKITGTPTTLAGYGITDGALNTTTLTINGVTFDLTANRTWNVGTVTSIATTGPITGGTITGSGTIGITQAGASSDGYLSSTDWNAFNNKQEVISVTAPLTFVAGVVGITQSGASSDGYLSSVDWNTFNSKVSGSGTPNTLPMWGSSTSLINSPLSYASDTFNFQYNSATGGTVVFTNSNGTAYAYTIQMNNFGSPRSTIHSYTDGLVIQSIGGTQVSRIFANGNMILGAGTVDNGYKLEITGDLYVNTIVNATTDTDRFLVSDGGVIKYRTGAQLLSDIGAQGALTLTTTGTTGAATLIGDVLNIPNYTTDVSGYVPYTGATQAVNLGVYGLIANGILANLVTVNPSGTNAGQIFFKHGSTFSLPSGFGSIGSDIGNQFKLYQVTSAGVFRGATLSLNGITASETRNFAFPDASGTIALVGGAGVGTVTSVSFSLGSSGTDLSSSVTNSTTTPAITLNVPTASASARGALSAADWTTFNGKQNAITLTTSGISGPATLIGSTLNIPNYSTDLSGYVTLDTTQTITGFKTILRGGDVLNFKIGTDTLYGLKVAYNQNELVPSGEATWSFVSTFNNGSGTGLETTPISFFRGVLVTGERLLSASINANLLDYYGNNPSGRYPIYAYNTGVQQFASSIIVGETTGVVNAVTGAITDLPAGVVANFKGRVIGSDAVNNNEFATLGQVTSTSRAAISLTTTGTSGPATYSSVTGVLNIPEYQGGVTSFNTRTGAVTLTSLDVTTALGFNPVTDARTLTINGVTYDLTANRTWTVGVNPSAREIETFIATSGQTVFTVTGGYTVGLVDVFINGVRLTSSDYAATNGTTVVLTIGTMVGNIVDIIKYTSGLVNSISGTGTTNELAYFTASTTISSLTTATYPSLTELSYVKGVTSSIQTQLNGKQNTLTNPVTGTGTTNYLPKFTGASTIGNSIVQDNGSTITVGGSVNLTASTSFPTVGFLNRTSDSTLYIVSPTSGFAITDNSLNTIYNGTPTAHNWNISNALKMTLSSSGNLLIGSPPAADNGARLQVSGTATISSALTSSDLTIKNSANAETLDLFLSPSTLNGFIDYPSGRSLTIRNKGSLGGLTIASTGAATFSSSVTAADLIISDTYANDPLIKLASTTSGNAEVQIRTATTTYNPGIGVVTAGYDFNIFTNNTPRLTITSGGNVNILSNSTNSTFSGSGSLGIKNNNSDPFLSWHSNTGSRIGYFQVQNSGDAIIGIEVNQALTFQTNSVERLRITSGGNVLIGTTTDNGAKLQVSGAATFSNFNGAAVYGVTINSNNNTGTQYMMSFDRIGVQAGYIASTSSTTAGIFNSSDYRLKEDLQSFSGIGKLMSMKFYDFKWKSEEGFRDYGVIAHELQEVLPMAVIGEKDGEVNQGVDYSKLIPIMAKAIQELKAELDELKSKN
jgi:hypothetical protein